jgi:hypothetical protein
MEAIIDQRYKSFDTRRKQREVEKADYEDLKELEKVEHYIKEKI